MVAFFALLVAVAAAQPAGWLELASMPLAPSGLAVEEGGWLASADYQGSRYIFACKGNSTFDFFRYAVDEDRWESLPAFPVGFDSEPVERGARGVFDGERWLYATKGNRTLEFYGYDVAQDTWYRLPDVPLGPSRNKVSAGTDLAIAGTGDTAYVYLLKGGTKEFYRFNTVSGAWEQVTDAPAGSKEDWDQGSFLVHDCQRCIYAQKGDVHELYRVDLDSFYWSSQLAPLPYIGRSGSEQELGWGGGGRWLDGYIYALKGDNSQEFWQYDPGQDTWVELDTIPSFGSTGRRKKVDRGGHLATLPGAVYALKGNATVEFWRYTIGVGVEERTGMRAESRGMRQTICRDVLRIEDGRRKTVDRADLLDISGRKVMDLQPGPNDIRHVAPGVYFVFTPSPQPSPPEGERRKERGPRSAASGKRSEVIKVVIQR
jgi:hypothetical protein